jgi:hypothetical protein
MIVRIRHGYTTRENADIYKNLLSEIEFITVLWFDSLESVRVFPGQDHEAAVVPPKARAVLKRFDERSQHNEVRERLRGS